MLKLIKLELKKIKMSGYIKGAIIANIAIIGVLCIIMYGSAEDLTNVFPNIKKFFMMIDSLVKSVFIIFASVLIAKLIIEDYKNKTITLLFMYPINRKKLLIAKLSIVLTFTFLSVFISDTIISILFSILNTVSNFVPYRITGADIAGNLISFGLNSLAAAGMGLIPFYFGMIKKSVPATIVSAILIVSIVCSDTSGFSLNSIIAIPISLAIIGLFIAYMSIRNIEHVDIS